MSSPEYVIEVPTSLSDAAVARLGEGVVRALNDGSQLLILTDGAKLRDLRAPVLPPPDTRLMGEAVKGDGPTWLTTLIASAGFVIAIVALFVALYR